RRECARQIGADGEQGAATQADPPPHALMLVGNVLRVTRRNQLLIGLAVLVFAVLAVMGYCTRVSTRDSPPQTVPASTPASGLPTVKVGQLPKEAAQTLALIDKGGPYPYDRDGITFANQEKLLPKRPNGYYKEYTLPTPGERDRGARRLIVGKDGDVYYTDDHYASFRQVLR